MRVELREVREGDLEALYAFQAEPEIVASGFVPVAEGPIAWQAHVGGFLAGLLCFPLLDPVGRRPDGRLAS